CCVCFAFTVVPQTQLRPRPGHARSAKYHDKQCAENFFCCIHAQFSTGCYDWFAKHFKPAKLSQCETKINFFSGKILFVEPPGGAEILSRCEKICARAKIEPKIDGAEDA